MFRLEPMDEAAFRAWMTASIHDYAAEKVEAGTWLADDSVERAAGEFAALLPDGRQTAGHEIRSMINDADERVGMVWFAVENRPIGRVAFIYDISVEPAHRRRGYGQAALGEVEGYAREHDCHGVQLHVFGGNTGARQLYRRAGYVETDVMMLKRVDG
jgi:ribosomal protein S18 acetylase RimI-like enzyme